MPGTLRRLPIDRGCNFLGSRAGAAASSGAATRFRARRYRVGVAGGITSAIKLPLMKLLPQVSTMPMFEP